ncbi:MAG: hypothetical protein ACKVT0_19140, partial [Planctomycetaceae bacterium]
MCNWWPCCDNKNKSYNIRRYDHDGNVIWSKKIEEGAPIYKVMAFSGSTPLFYFVHSLMTIPRIARYDMTDQSAPMWSANANYISQQIFGPSGGSLTLITIVDFEIDGAGNAYVLVSGGPSQATCYVVKLNGDTGQYVWHKQLQWSIGASTFRPVCRSIAVNTSTGYSYVICDPIRRPHEPALPSVQYCNIIAVEPTGAAFQTGSTHGTPPWTTIPNAPTSVDCDSNNNQIFVTLRADGSKNCAVVLNAGLSAQWSGSPGNSQFEGCVNGQSTPRRALSFGDFTLAEGIRRFYLRDGAGALADNASFKLMTGPIANVAIYGNRQ